MSNVKLAIRVRPFTEREIKSEKDRIPVVNIVDDHTVTITNIKVNVSGAGDSRERVRRYSADYTFDSACPENDPAYASQEKVFESIGREVLSSVSRGSSACVLAYGQSATGKTHTMMGTEDEPGLVPRLCRAFAEGTLDVTVSFLEIYNERVHDLLAGEPLPGHSLPRRRGNASKDLRVREHPQRGPYVQNLRRVAVTDVETLLSLVEEGARRRRTAATRRNSTSSRSHALLELSTPRATLHLADLAGSEKASWEGCGGGGRQKEGANINKSLVALSNVISALVAGGSRGRFVPYRDSALTWLLRDCFTGGASTFIIATVSPSVACYGESASTLRWAERARQLRTPRAISTAPSTASRTALQAQLNQLLAELANQHILYNLQTGKITYDETHWTLPANTKNVQLIEINNTEPKIGNLINMFTPKPDAHSESTASSVASESSEIMSLVDKDTDLKKEITKEVDKLLTPALERTRSGTDLEVMAPLRNKRRQYKSHEVLAVNKTLPPLSQSSTQPSPSQSQEQINETVSEDKLKQSHIPILYDNQRAEIVASVTERLYSKLKKKEEAAVSKMENMVDKKVMEPLSELRICTNARQRLMELSNKALRTKRRIGIPAHTQTRLRVTRVKDQGIDVQTDLASYILRKDGSHVLQRDAATETIPMTPRCKEISVGPIGSLDFRDRGTSTEVREVVHKNSYVMTDVFSKCDRYSQTPPPKPPPRRKRRALNSMTANEHHQCCLEECYSPSVISINISQQCPADSESQSSDDNFELQSSDDNPDDDQAAFNKLTNVSTTPDLLTNHNNIDTSALEDSEAEALNDVGIHHSANITNLKGNAETPEKVTDEFPDESSEGLALPRVTVASVKSFNHDEMKDIILGRNETTYPYNIVLSPPRERDSTKRIVTFKENEAVKPSNPPMTVASQTDWHWAQEENKKYNLSSESSANQDNLNFNNSGSGACSDSTASSTAESGLFIWKSCNRSTHQPNTNYKPVYKNNSKHRSARAKIYKEFLGLNDCNEASGMYEKQYLSLGIENESSSDSTESQRSQYRFLQKRQYFENKLKESKDPNNEFDVIEKKILESCKSLDHSVNKYENYLVSLYNNQKRYSTRQVPIRTPKEYLQHLVQLRREMVKTEYDTTDSSVGISRR